MRSDRLARVVALVLIAGAAGLEVACRQDMHDQPSYSALETSTFFADKSSARTPPEGTVARGHLREDAVLYTGRVGDELSREMPFPVDEALLARGREMYGAFCSHCHGRTGVGDGPVVQRGFTKPPSLFDDRIKAAPIGHIFDVITTGLGDMPDHASQITVRDRWAIAAYVRALQTGAARPIDDGAAAVGDRLTPATGAAGSSAR